MDNVTPEVDFEEIEKLLCEIPNATSGIPNYGFVASTENSQPRPLSLDDIENPIASYRAHQNFPIKELPTEQSLASAFEELNFNELKKFEETLSSTPSIDYRSFNLQSQKYSSAGFEQKFINVGELEKQKMAAAAYTHGVQGGYFLDNRFCQPQNHPHITLRRRVNGENCFMTTNQQFLLMQQQFRNQKMEANEMMSPPLDHNYWKRPVYGNVDHHSQFVVPFQFMDRMRSPNHEQSFIRTVKSGSFGQNDQLSEKIYLMARDQHGCRSLQKKFTEGTKEEIEMISSEVIIHIVELMTDPFGNYLVQKLLEVCKHDQQMQILHSITRKPGDLIRISCDMHGTRAVQKVIETLRTREQFSMVVSALKPGIVTLMKNTNGNHVAQRCLQYLRPEYIEFLFEAATAHCIELATDRHGCCVLQKCLGLSSGVQKAQLICQITSNTPLLSEDQFGNYVVQFILENQIMWASSCILEQLEGSHGYLSMQKYSSNVVEKCLKFGGEERQANIINELINNPRFDQIMQDPYGNYVIQAGLRNSKGAAIHAKLVAAIEPYIPMLRTSPYGKKILSCSSFKK
ncbi:pumilio homolog 12-like [Impatiens glandulifera]|uniref:pumilio homolog 12-like n=1 Tax=Impatiens glandulifera TaxID=253017 RepID=UPI001FB09E11|nr:pumilio homolog 12-like [Impatiens glandulifera]XP_047313612.1 pumilio homolog 12-like [Impatiens glandulifera]